MMKISTLIKLGLAATVLTLIPRRSSKHADYSIDGKVLPDHLKEQPVANVTKR